LKSCWMMRFGIGITTRNRPHVVASALEHFLAFPTADARYVIVDDASDDTCDVETVVRRFSELTDAEVIYRKSPQRMGISNAKNACLAKFTDCEYVFLFDDDSWPIAEDWAEKWVAVNEINEIGHSMFNVVNPSLLSRNTGFNSLICISSKINRFRNTMVELTNSFGVVLYFTRPCLDALGGFDPATPHFYGFEHVQMSRRATAAGFTKGKTYLVPEIASTLIYSVDINYIMLRLLPPLETPWLSGFSSSVAATESQEAYLNIGILDSPPIHIPLVDPIAD
jgi:glycosyltransferase involved in cell wall biosynthesis